MTFEPTEIPSDSTPVEASATAVAEQPSFDLQTTDTLTFTDLEKGRGLVFQSLDTKQAFRRSLEEMGTSGDEGRRRGLGFWMLADYARCADELAAFDSDTTSPEAVTAAYTRARALMALGRHAEAITIFRRLTEAHAGHPRPRAGLIEAELESAYAEDDSRIEEIAAEVEAKVRAAPNGFADTSDGRYLLGRAAELVRDWESAVEHYEAGRASEPDHHALLLRFGHLANRWGLDDLSLELYEALLDLGSMDKHALMNLGVLYEDLGRDSDAAACYDVVLRNDGTDDRARLYLADARAGIDMFYDEDMEKKEDRLNQILRIPITDFELSVRARNCLNKMQITTLGDLVQRTEQELLSYKNFGETSLTEIKEILHSKGLRLGMPREEAVASIEAHANRTTSSDRSNVTNKPILDLQLSIRARRTVETLGCLTVGDITKHSAEELLGMPNFGQTSLQELRNKLQELGLKLKGD